MPTFKFRITNRIGEIRTTEVELSDRYESVNVAMNAIAQFMGNNIPPPPSVEIEIFTDDDAWLGKLACKFEMELAHDRPN